jgi:hypothetical protein
MELSHIVASIESDYSPARRAGHCKRECKQNAARRGECETPGFPSAAHAAAQLPVFIHIAERPAINRHV